PIPFAGAVERGVAVALAGRGIKPQTESRRHDDDVILAGIDAISDRPVDGGIVVNIDVIVDHDDVLIADVTGRAAPQRVGHLLGLAAIALLDLHQNIDAGLHRRTPNVSNTGDAGSIEHVPR